MRRSLLFLDIAALLREPSLQQRGHKACQSSRGRGMLPLLIAILLSLAPGMLHADALVADHTTESILRFSNTGNLIGTFVASGSGGLKTPYQLSFGPDGNLYVCDSFGNDVLRYNGSTGAFMDAFVPPGSGGLQSPYTLTFGPDGNLYVLSEGMRQVSEYNGVSGAFIRVFASGNMVAPRGIAFGPDGNLYIADEINVLKYNGITGGYIGVFVSAGTGGLNEPVSLAFGPDGDLYVSGANSGVSRYNELTGSFIDNFVPFAGTGYQIAFSPEGNLYLSVNNGSTLGSIFGYNGQTGAFIGNLVPSGGAGEVYGFTFMPGTSNTGPPQASRIVPAIGGNAGTTTVQISGSGFQSGATVTLTGSGNNIVGTNTSLLSSGVLSTTLNLTNASPGVRNVVVNNPDGTSSTLSAAFAVVQGGSPQLWAQLFGSAGIRVGTAQAYYIGYGNLGTTDALGTRLMVYIPTSVAPNLTLGNANGVVTAFAQGATTVVTIDVGRVPAGSTSFIPVTLTAGASQAPFQIQVNISGH